MKVRVDCVVSGRVQGVSFRAYTKKVADKLNITGWVKNLPDDRVETIAEGEEEDIEKFLKLLKMGPMLSKVENVKVERKKFTGSFSDFEIIF